MEQGSSAFRRRLVLLHLCKLDRQIEQHSQGVISHFHKVYFSILASDVSHHQLYTERRYNYFLEEFCSRYGIKIFLRFDHSFDESTGIGIKPSNYYVVEKNRLGSL